jgi:hypothetical protein
MFDLNIDPSIFDGVTLFVGGLVLQSSIAGRC